MKELSLNISADIVAWYGAVLSTVSIIFIYLNYIRDRAKIKIELNTDVYLNHPRYKQGEKYIDIKITNIGRRPIFISTASMKIYGEKMWFQPTDSIIEGRPLVIDERNPWTSMYVLQSKINYKNIYLIRVIDGTGCVYNKYLYKFPTVHKLIHSIKMINNT